MKGPFLIERGTYLFPLVPDNINQQQGLLAAPTADDHIVGPLVISSLLALGRRTPR